MNDTLVVEARIKPNDIAFMYPGLPAVVKLSAYDFSLYGGLEAVSYTHLTLPTSDLV